MLRKAVESEELLELTAAQLNISPSSTPDPSVIWDDNPFVTVKEPRDRLIEDAGAEIPETQSNADGEDGEDIFREDRFEQEAGDEGQPRTPSPGLPPSSPPPPSSPSGSPPNASPPLHESSMSSPPRPSVRSPAPVSTPSVPRQDKRPLRPVPVLTPSVFRPYLQQATKWTQETIDQFSSPEESRKRTSKPSAQVLKVQKLSLQNHVAEKHRIDRVRREHVF